MLGRPKACFQGGGQMLPRNLTVLFFVIFILSVSFADEPPKVSKTPEVPLEKRSVQLTTFYPVPHGSYGTVTLQPDEKELVEPCAFGSLAVDSKKQLNFCTEIKEKPRWVGVNVRLERGSLELQEKDTYRVEFAKPFSDVPLIQTYVNAQDEQGSAVYPVVAPILLTDISNQGFEISYGGSENALKVVWIAVGD